jgi:hypothetical protein
MSNALLNYHIVDGEPCGSGETLDNISQHYGTMLMDKDMVFIPRKRYEELLKNERWLRALEAEGVDNWEGHDIAIDRLSDEDRGIENDED